MLIRRLQCPLCLARLSPTIKYPYAHTKRIRASQSRTQARTLSSQTTAVLGPFSAHHGRFTRHKDHRVCSCLLWLILTILLIVLVPSIRAYQFLHTCNGQANSMNTVQGRCQKFVYASLLCKLVGISPAR